MIGVVGARGFIGNALSSFLISQGEEVVEYTSTEPIFNDQGLVSNFDKLNQIVWCASKVNPSSASTHPDLVEQDIANWNIFISLLKMNKSKKPRIIFLSSAGCTYSDTNLPFNEQSAAEGTNAYGKLKIRIEELLNSSGLDFVIIRLSNVYGSDQPRGRGQGVLAEWIGAIKESAPIKVFGSLTQFRDYIHILDVCRAINIILKSSLNKEIFNIGSGEATSLKDILEIFQETGVTIPETQIFPARGFDRHGYYLDIGKITTSTHWSPSTPTRVGISELVQKSRV